MSQLRTNERLRLLVVFWLQALPEASQAYTSCNSFSRWGARSLPELQSIPEDKLPLHNYKEFPACRQALWEGNAKHIADCNSRELSVTGLYLSGIWRHGGDKHQPLLEPSQTLGTPGYSMLKGPARMLELTAFCIFIFIFIFYKIPGPCDTGFWFLFCF